MSRAPDPHPEDLFIDRYMPGASAEEREEARQNVDQLIGFLVRINDRLLREERERDSQETEGRGKIETPVVIPEA